VLLVDSLVEKNKIGSLVIKCMLYYCRFVWAAVLYMMYCIASCLVTMVEIAL
jgi:hypothetical protein